MSGGSIYTITNRVTGSVYVGSSVQEVRFRWHRHRTDLRRGVHHSRHLQRSWVKHGEPAFAFDVVEIVANEAMVIEREQHHIDAAIERVGREMVYNVLLFADSRIGHHPTDETRARMSAAQRLRVRKPEEVEAQIAAWERKAAHTIRDPNGQVHAFGNARLFARKHGLEPSALGLVLRGKNVQHQGWTRPDAALFGFVSPDGEAFTDIVILKDFCDPRGLRMKNMSAVHRGARNHHQGWTKWSY